MSVELITGEALERSPVVLLRQITGTEDGELVTQADIASITYDVWNVPMTRARYLELFGNQPGTGLSSVSIVASGTPELVVEDQPLTVSAVVFDTPQLDDRWTQDAIGYNFAVTIPAEHLTAILLEDYPNPEWVEIWINFVPVIGDPFSSGFVLMKKFSLASRAGTGT
jgi:hypothetical protein